MNVPAPLQTYIAGLEAHDIDRIGSSFAPDIRFVTPVRTMRRDEILDFLTSLYRGFPDWRYDHDPPVAEDEPDLFRVTWRQGGTHTGDLEFHGFPRVTATGRRVVIPEQPFFYRADDEGLHEIRPKPIPGGAPRGIFEQIGVELPPL